MQLGYFNNLLHLVDNKAIKVIVQQSIRASALHHNYQNFVQKWPYTDKKETTEQE